MPLRSLICTIEGHVDHGKTSVLDRIRGSSVAEGEAGKITQAIGAYIVPLETIKKICGQLLSSLKMDFTIPGLLFIDTPGHAAFTNLRKRGGNLADIAVVVIDINEGIMPQTETVLRQALRERVKPILFINKVDRLIKELKLTPEKIQERFMKIIASH
jgi:translation initiation factor 5B